MRKTRLTLLLPLLLGLTACGGESDNDVVDVDSDIKLNPKIENPAWNYVETPYFELKGLELEGEATVVLGSLDDQVQQWSGMGLALLFGYGDASRDVNGDGFVNQVDASMAGIKNKESGPDFSVDLETMGEYLKTNPDGLGAGTASPETFKPGSYSVFDLLRYLVGTRDDMRWEGGVESIIKPEDSTAKTYEYHISWDSNGDGKFDSSDGEYFNSNLWHFSMVQSVGQNKHYAGKRGNTTYIRMDQFWLREDQRVRFTVFSEEMINRMRWTWKREVQRLADNDGKFIIPLVQHRDLDVSFTNPPTETIAENLEVKAHNLRSDIFQDGVVTQMDVWLTIADNTGADFRLTWWPILSSGAKVNSFTFMHNPWDGANPGWGATVPWAGELATGGDFSMVVPTCNWNKDGSTTFNEDGSIGSPTDPVDRATCIKDWSYFNSLGADQSNLVYSAAVLAYPPEYVAMATIFKAEHVRNGTEVNLQYGDVFEMYVGKDELQHTRDTLGVKGDQPLYPTEDVTGTAVLRPMYAATEETKIGNALILDENHFGWKIADCTQCHKDTVDNKLGHGGQPWPVNSVDGFDYMQPYYCATCHGSNGAPQGHNRAARCFWCHNTNNKDGKLDRLWMDKHGDASLPKFIPAEKNVSNHFTRITAPANNLGEWELYDDLWYPSHNSDYTLSKTFPDPYSCGTCHGFEHEMKPKVEE